MGTDLSKSSSSPLVGASRTSSETSSSCTEAASDNFSLSFSIIVLIVVLLSSTGRCKLGGAFDSKNFLEM